MTYSGYAHVPLLSAPTLSGNFWTMLQLPAANVDPARGAMSRSSIIHVRGNFFMTDPPEEVRDFYIQYRCVHAVQAKMHCAVALA